MPIRPGPYVNPFAEGESVHGLADERAQYEQIECAVEQVFGVAGHRPSTKCREKMRAKSPSGQARDGWFEIKC
jgi:hypothetical protein